MKKMNNSIKFLAMAFSFALVSVFSSCDGGDDDPIIIDEDPVVADGFYILGSSTAADPDEDLEFGPGTVGSGETREGFYAAYVYLAVGDVNFVLYSNNEPTTFGGSVEAIPLYEGSDYSYWKGALTEDGSAVSITDAGLYHVRVDLTSDLFFLTRVDYFEIIGSSTPGGWGTGTELSGTVTAAGGSFTGTNITLRSGEFKFRYNSNWDNAIEGVEGLNIHSNFGVDIIAGGPNIQFDQADANFTVTVTYTPGAGESLSYTLTKTGEAEEITFDPAEYNMGVIGSATAGAWDSDQTLAYKGIDATKGHRWVGVVYMLTGQAYKFRANDAWDFALGGVVVLGEEAEVSTSGADIVSPEADGAYYVELYTADEGTTWKTTVVSAGWGIIGFATTGDDTGWNQDIDLTANGFADGITTYSATIDLFAGAYKFRANNDWTLNVGGDLAALSVDGTDLTTAAGTYIVTLSFDGVTYSATLEGQ